MPYMPLTLLPNELCTIFCLKLYQTTQLHDIGNIVNLPNNTTETKQNKTEQYAMGLALWHSG